MRSSIQTILLGLTALFALSLNSMGTASSVTGLAHPNENPAHLTLAWRDGHELFPYDLRIMTREVESLFEAWGVRIDWELDDESISKFEPALNVVLLPSEPSGPGWRIEASAMGAFLHETGAERTVYIFFPNVMRAIRLDPQIERILSLRERRDLSRALARVVAHEVIHAIAPSLPHSSKGLMSASLDSTFLTKRKVLVDARSGDAFVRSLRRWLPARQRLVAKNRHR
jgi:hypothetical protein